MIGGREETAVDATRDEARRRWYASHRLLGFLAATAELLTRPADRV
jgi:hypothetical protein